MFSTFCRNVVLRFRSFVQNWRFNYGIRTCLYDVVLFKSFRGGLFCLASTCELAISKRFISLLELVLSRRFGQGR